VNLRPVRERFVGVTANPDGLNVVLHPRMPAPEIVFVMILSLFPTSATPT
jgi:hypothetical protein